MSTSDVVPVRVVDSAVVRDDPQVETRDRRIRILRIVTRLNTGGPAVYLATLARGLSATRYEQWLAAGREGPGEGSMLPYVQARGIEPIALPEMTGTPRLGPGDALTLLRARQLIRDLQPDIVETHLTKAGIIGRIAARLEHPTIVIHVYHGHVLARYFGPAKAWVARCAERQLARISDRLVAVSPRVRQELLTHAVAEAGHIQVIEPGIEMDALLQCRRQRGAFRRELGVGEDTPLVGIVGRLCPIKNHELFLDAAFRIAAEWPAVRFVVVGDGERGGALRERARRLNLTHRTIFTGWRYDLDRVYADLDVLALCSDNEGAPIVLIEAMAAGCPVVSTAVGGVPDLIVHQQTGLLVPPRQPEVLAVAITSLLMDQPTAGALARAAQSHVSTRFRRARFVSEMDGLYQQLLHDRARLQADGALKVRRSAGRPSAAPDKDVESHAPA